MAAFGPIMSCGTAEIYRDFRISLLLVSSTWSLCHRLPCLHLTSTIIPLIQTASSLSHPSVVCHLFSASIIFFFFFSHVFMLVCSCFQSGQSMVLYNLEVSKSSWLPLSLLSAQSLDKESFKTQIYLSPELPLSLIQPGLVLFRMLEVVCNLTSEFCITDELLQFTLPETVRAFLETPGTLTSFDKM